MYEFAIQVIIQIPASLVIVDYAFIIFTFCKKDALFLSFIDSQAYFRAAIYQLKPIRDFLSIPN